MPQYPPPIRFNDFRDPLTPPDPTPRNVNVTASRMNLQSTDRNTHDVWFCGVSKLWLDTPGKTGPRDKAWDKAHDPAPDNAPARWFFAPREETVDIGWTFCGRTASTTHMANQVVAVLELFGRGDSAPIWRKGMLWKPGTCPLNGKTQFNGCLDPQTLLAADGDPDVKIHWLDKDRFPDGVLTVDRSPYKLKLTLVKAGDLRKCPSKWVYFDVLVGRIILRWGKDTMLRDRPVDPSIPNTYPAKVLACEKAILQELVTANPKPENDNVNKVILPSNLFAIRKLGATDTEENFKGQVDFEEYKKLWGDGARIPLLAKVAILTSTGKGTIGVPEALGRTRVLWDWTDPQADRWKDALSGGAAPQTQNFLQDAYKEHDKTATPASCNCPKDFGGKRGDNSATVFPDNQPDATFPFKVEAAGVERPWSAISDFGKLEDKQRDDSGVIFQPVRMAGETYTLQATVWFPDSQLDDQPIDIPRLQTKTATFKVFRRVKVWYLKRANDATLGCVSATMATYMRTQYLRECDIELDIVEQPVNAAGYTQAIVASVNAGPTVPDSYKQYPSLMVLLRNFVDQNPPADSAGVPYVSGVQFKQNMESDFRARRIKIFSALANAPNFLLERITGQTTAAQGVLINLTPPMVLCSAGQENFADAENVKGFCSTTTGSVTLAKIGNCWDHTCTFNPSTDKKYKDKVSVFAPDGTEFRVEYKKLGLGRELATEPSESVSKKLNEFLLNAGLTQNPANSFDIRVEGRDDTDNAKTRRDFLLGLIEQAIKSAAVIIDRKSVCARVQDRNDVWFWSCLKDMARTGRDLADKSLLGMFMSKYVSLQHPNDEGIFLFQFPCESNTYALDICPPTYKPPRVTGAIYADMTQRRDQAVVYCATVPVAVANPAPSKSLESVFSHELGHALYLPHAYDFATGDAPSNTHAEVHVYEDNCVMNYDLQGVHFCGMCMLRMRGWNWKDAKPAEKAYEYQITLEMGNVEELFSPPGLVGLRERLQVLGLFSHPLSHPEVDACSQFSATHTTRLLGLTRATVWTVLKQQIEQYVITGGALPPAGSFAKLRLPKFRLLDSQFRLKALFHDDQAVRPVGVNGQQADYDAHSLGAEPNAVDRIYFAANPALGKIPLVATVKRRFKNSPVSWALAEPADGADVIFKLLKPDPLPSYATSQATVAGATTDFAGVSAPDLTALPAALIKSKVEGYQLADTSSPVAKNAHVDMGGTRGTNDFTHGGVFRDTDAPTFTPIPPVSTTAISDHRYSAMRTADGNGVVKLVFAPSTVGGDQYKIRAYVRHPRPNVDGSAPGPDVFETGTIVRWRTVRVSRYLHMDPPANQTELPAELRAASGTASPTLTPQQQLLLQRAVNCTHTGSRICPTCLMRHGTQTPIDFASLGTEMARAYCELAFDPGADTPQPVSQYGAALLNEIQLMQAYYPSLNATARVKGANNTISQSPQKVPLPPYGNSNTTFRTKLPGGAIDSGNELLTVRPKNNQSFDAAILVSDANGVLVDTGRLRDGARQPTGVRGQVNYANGMIGVIFDQPTTAEYIVTYHPKGFLDFANLLYFPPKSPFLFNLHLPCVYNALIGPAFIPMEDNPVHQPGIKKPASHFEYVDNRDFGAVKGILMQALPWAVDANHGFMPGLIFIQAQWLDTYTSIWETGIQEGKAVGGSIYLFQPAGTPSAAELAKLALHETSHGLYMIHAPDAPGYKAELHDAADVCVMSYSANDGDYCGKCMAAMRGAKIDLI